MKIVYMGTPDFAVPALRGLCDSGYEVSAVVTQPDKAKDRGKKIQFTPVKETALEYGIPVLQPEKVKGNEEFFAELSAAAPDLIVVAAYGRILPPAILELPRLGCVNIHASLLPKYRGAAPIHRAIIDGEETTGVTLMYMAEGMDTGDMIAKAETPIGDKTVAELHEELAGMGTELLLAQLPLIEAGTNSRTPQDDALATHAPMIFKQDCFVDFHQRPERIKRLIQGTNSWPVAHTLYQGQSVKLWEAEVLDGETEAGDGTILAVDKSGMTVAAAGGRILIRKLQFPGKRAMSVEDYIKGNKIEIGAVLG